MLSVPPSVEDEPAEGKASVSPTRSRRWLRVPKAVLVTVLGLALSAWLIPALTRQWDDRQKEHELQAAVVGDMASATAHALVGGEAIWSGQHVTEPAAEQVRSQWALASLQLEARLRTYFPASVVAGWDIYSWAVDRFIRARAVSATAELEDAVGSGIRLDPRVADAAAHLLFLGEDTTLPAPNYGIDPKSKTPITDPVNLKKLRALLSPDIEQYEASGMVISKWTALEKRLLDFEQALAGQVIRSHAAGFSTSTRDLLRDLVP
jgi:hypothetical protein